MNTVSKAVIAVAAAFAAPVSAFAMCPLCTAAVAGGLGILEKYGVDDVISGLWIGALIVSMIVWTNDFLRKRGWTFRFYRSIVWVSYYILMLIPLYMKGYLFSGNGYFIGVDKLFFGIAVGSILFAAGGISYALYKAKHGRALFPFQKVVQPVGFVIIATAVFYFLTA